MTSLPESIAQYLENRGFGAYRDSDQVFGPNEVGIAIESVPSTPNQVICITQYAGATVDSQLPWDEPRIQLRVRGTPDPSISRNTAQALYDLFHGWGPGDMGTTHIQLIVGIGSGPMYMGLDQTSRRHEHVVNFDFTVYNPNRRT